MIDYFFNWEGCYNIYKVFVILNVIGVISLYGYI